MNKLTNERYNEIADYIDGLSDDDKLFALYKLMDFLRNHLREEMEEIDIDGDTGVDVRVKVMAYLKANEHMKFVGELEQILTYEVF